MYVYVYIYFFSTSIRRAAFSSRCVSFFRHASFVVREARNKLVCLRPRRNINYVIGSDICIYYICKGCFESVKIACSTLGSLKESLCSRYIVDIGVSTTRRLRNDKRQDGSKLFKFPSQQSLFSFPI